MGAPLLDTEFQQYWLKLSTAEKRSLLFVARQYVELKGEANPAALEAYNNELEAAMQEIDEGQFYTHDEVTRQSQSWLNGK